MNQSYTKRDSSHSLLQITAKVTNNLLMAGNNESLKSFSSIICEKFEASKGKLYRKITFNGCDIEQFKKGDIKLCVNQFNNQ